MIQPPRAALLAGAICPRRLEGQPLGNYCPVPRAVLVDQMQNALILLNSPGPSIPPPRFLVCCELCLPSLPLQGLQVLLLLGHRHPGSSRQQRAGARPGL